MQAFSVFLGWVRSVSGSVTPPASRTGRTSHNVSLHRLAFTGRQDGTLAAYAILPS